MSHEIRTPLNSILGFTKIIQRRNVSPDISEFAGAIGHAGENLLRIVNDVLDLSKMEAGMLQIVKMPFSLRNLIHGVEALFQESINEKQLSFTVVIDAEVPDMINGDATRLTQILVNLIGNAVKFSDHGEISLAIVAEKIQNFELLLKFTVGDQGIGINSEKLDIIFERFRQAEDSITRQYGGTGLGLSIVRSLIHLQNGTLEINSQPKIGTEICFTLPYETADEIPPANVKANENQIDFKKNPIHLLVVEDNMMNQSLMKQLLLDWGIAFSIAADGVQAIELLEHKNFDLILMDLQMPRMDGYATTRHIRENLQLQIPVVAMTARVIEGEQQKCLDFGMDYYISKPINDAVLLSILAAFTPAGVESQQRTLPVILPQYNYIDLTYIKSVSNGNTQYEKSVTGQFLEMVPNLLEAIQLAYTNGNFKEICKIAHNMQTSFAIMGVPPRHSNALDILENPDIQDEDISGALQVLANVCTCAMKDAADFYNTLP
jgi:CheY-like chemotaxis protein